MTTEEWIKEQLDKAPPLSVAQIAKLKHIFALAKLDRERIPDKTRNRDRREIQWWRDNGLTESEQE